MQQREDNELGLDVFEWLDEYRHDLTDAEIAELMEIAIRNESAVEFEDIAESEIERTNRQLRAGDKPVNYAAPYGVLTIPEDDYDSSRGYYRDNAGLVVNFDGVPIFQWVKPFANPYGSTWIERMYFQPYDYPCDYGNLFVEFLSGFMCCYKYTPLQDWVRAVRAPSKGVWVYWECHKTGRPYETMQEATRSGAAIYDLVKPILDYRKRTGGTFNTKPKRRRWS